MRQHEGQVAKRHGLGLVFAVLLVLFIAGPFGVWVSYQLIPPEQIITPRVPEVSRVVPGQTFRWVGTYKILRHCTAKFSSIMEWTSRDGQQFKQSDVHFGSVELVPNGELPISRKITVPKDALPGTKLKYRTVAEWKCLPWIGAWDTGTKIEYNEIVVEIGY